MDSRWNDARKDWNDARKEKRLASTPDALGADAGDRLGADSEAGENFLFESAVTH
jgi:hypothetical protein